jgi:hypothetical protein
LGSAGREHWRCQGLLVDRHAVHAGWLEPEPFGLLFGFVSLVECWDPQHAAA